MGWLLWDVIGVRAIIFQQTENMLRVLEAHCSFKWKIIHSLGRKWNKNSKNKRVIPLFWFTHTDSFIYSFLQLNTHIDPLNSISKLQGFVKGVHIDSVG